jgi:1,4-dihydroxy-2-naphthoyl-CoA hydrolase
MIFTYRRRIYLEDTDAAGVIYFARLMSICHETYEVYLTGAGLNFRELVEDSTLAIPIVHAEVDFLRPIFCADELLVKMTSEIITAEGFTLGYHLYKSEELVAKAITKHLVINPQTRRRCPLPSKMRRCLETIKPE